MSCCPFLHAPFFRSKQHYLNNPQRWPKLPLMFPPVLPVLLLQLDQNYKLQPLTKPSFNQNKKERKKRKRKETMSHGQPNRPQPKQRDAPDVPMNMGSAAIDGDPITIGEALEAAAISAGDKAVDQNDADAISAAEIRATGEDSVRPGGVGATAQSAATLNSHFTRREDMAKLSDVLTDATEKLAVDRAVTKEDAEAVYAAEVQFPRRRNATEMNAEGGGVAASMATAAKLNQEN